MTELTNQSEKDTTISVDFSENAKGFPQLTLKIRTSFNQDELTDQEAEDRVLGIYDRLYPQLEERRQRRVGG